MCFGCLLSPCMCVVWRMRASSADFYVTCQTCDFAAVVLDGERIAYVYKCICLSISFIPISPGLIIT